MNIFFYLLASVLIFTFIFALITFLIYDKIFSKRYEMADKPLSITLSLDDFPNLIATPVSFHTNDSLLKGNFYRSSVIPTTQKYLMIFCHGISNGSRDYLAQINYFAQQGIEVLAYDNTGSHNSSGKGIRGLPQSLINLRDVLRLLSTDEEFKSYAQLPLILVGHSWGAFAVNTILNYKEFKNIKVVVSFSAFNRSIDMLVQQGKHLFGKAIILFQPFLTLIESIRFKEVSHFTSLSGVNNSQIPVLAIHSKDDPIVTYENSLVAKSSQCTNSNAIFIAVDGCKHNITLSQNARDYGAELRASIQIPKHLDFKTEVEKYLVNVDKMRLYELDIKRMEFILAFITESIV